MTRRRPPVCERCGEQHPPRGTVERVPLTSASKIRCAVCGVPVEDHIAEFGVGGLCPEWPSSMDPIFAALGEILDAPLSRSNDRLGKLPRGRLVRDTTPNRSVAV